MKANNASGRPSEVYDWIISKRHISEAELAKTNRNGRSNFENKVAFARFYLTKAGYIDGSTRGVWALTEKGRQASLDESAALKIFDEAPAVLGKGNRKEDVPDTNQIAPDDDAVIVATDIGNDIDVGEFYNLSESQVAIADTLKSMSPKGFEEFCARIFRTMGFENVKVQGGASDRGIDGTGELLSNRFLRTRLAFHARSTRRAPQ